MLKIIIDDYNTRKAYNNKSGGKYSYKHYLGARRGEGIDESQDDGKEKL